MSFDKIVNYQINEYYGIILACYPATFQLLFFIHLGKRTSYGQQTYVLYAPFSFFSYYSLSGYILNRFAKALDNKNNQSKYVGT